MSYPHHASQLAWLFWINGVKPQGPPDLSNVFWRTAAAKSGLILCSSMGWVWCSLWLCWVVCAQEGHRIDLHALDTNKISKCSLKTVLLQRSKAFQHPKVNRVLWQPSLLCSWPGFILNRIMISIFMFMLNILSLYFSSHLQPII